MFFFISPHSTLYIRMIAFYKKKVLTINVFVWIYVIYHSRQNVIGYFSLDFFLQSFVFKFEMRSMDKEKIWIVISWIKWLVCILSSILINFMKTKKMYQKFHGFNEKNKIPFSYIFKILSVNLSSFSCYLSHSFFNYLSQCQVIWRNENENEIQ